MTKDEIERAKALCEAATDGPWVENKYREVWTSECPKDLVADAFLKQPDAKFIAASRELVPKLIAEVERLRGIATELGMFETRGER